MYSNLNKNRLLLFEKYQQASRTNERTNQQTNKTSRYLLLIAPVYVGYGLYFSCMYLSLSGGIVLVFAATLKLSVKVYSLNLLPVLLRFDLERKQILDRGLIGDKFVVAV